MKKVDWCISCNKPADDCVCAKAEQTFESELRALINKYSLEGDSNTPDFILASFLSNVLTDWNHAVNAREKWFGRR